MLLSPDQAKTVTQQGFPTMLTHRPQRREAFTLLEVLIVVTMIALLIAILLPTLTRARAQVRSTACESNLKQLANGMFFYISDQKVLPGTHSLFFFQNLFGGEWSRPAGVTWDGARDKLRGLVYTQAYAQPYYDDPEFAADVPGKGTIFRYVKNEDVYTCPSDKPGQADDTPAGGGGNGRLSYSMNAHAGYRAPEQLRSFRYAADSLNNPLPNGRGRRSFKAGERVEFATASFKLLFEDHPNYHMNTSWPDGNFNGLDRISLRHLPSGGSANPDAEGRSSMGFLDGHVESRLYKAKPDGRALFTEYGQPYFWHESGPVDRANTAAFIKRLTGPSPWG